MGYGDEIMASASARGLKAQGKRAAFGDGKTIRWHPHAYEIFRHNINVAAPGSEKASDLVWIKNCAGDRPYCKFSNGRWTWTSGHCRKGEIFFSDEEKLFAEKIGGGFVLMEPNVPKFKRVASNKQWPVWKYNEVAKQLMASGTEVLQCIVPPPYGPGHVIAGATRVKTPDFRHALAIETQASLYVGPEGGLHHGAAAVGCPAVVIFGGFISPEITGYPEHANLFTGERACGYVDPCAHCVNAMSLISIEDVLEAAKAQMRPERPLRLGGKTLRPDRAEIIRRFS